MKVVSRVKHKFREYFDRREVIHFLHIGKNAGTQIGFLSRQINESHSRYRIERHSHKTGLRDIPGASPFFFSVRLPESRFKSGFYSRKRKGQPRIHVEWSADEARAFSEFEHANDLAEALFEDGRVGFQALSAMKSISHCSMEQINWFDCRGFFLETRPPLSIIRQEHFDTDFRSFVSRIGFEGPLEFAKDEKAAHRFDYSEIPPLSEKAKTNLREWYRQDLEFYRLCEAWIKGR